MSTFYESRKCVIKENLEIEVNASVNKTENRKRICFRRNQTIGGLRRHCLHSLFSILVFIII